MRAQIHPLGSTFLPQSRSIALAATGLLSLAVTMPLPAIAQGSPGSFTLPAPTPTPTPAPQGPVDIRDGVVIGPRTIPEDRPQPAPAPAPAASSNDNAPSVPEERATASPEPGTAIPATSSTPAPTIAPEPVIETAQTGTLVPELSDEASDTPEPLAQPTGPGFSDDNLYSGEESGEGAVRPGDSFDPIALPQSSGGMSQSLIAAAIAALLTLLAGLGWWLWRRHESSANAPDLLRAPALAAGVRASIANTQGETTLTPRDSTPHPRPAPTPTPAPIPPVSSSLELKLDITSASRSMMMFTVEYRLTIANRSDRAMRDLALSTRLVCARSGAAAKPGSEDGPIQLVERIGPHQSRTIAGAVQLPLRDITPMQQGSTPLFVPLLLMTREASGQPTKTHSFVLGTPSTTGSNRLHPIALDGLPGGIPGLRAQEVKHAPAGQTA